MKRQSEVNLSLIYELLVDIEKHQKCGTKEAMTTIIRSAIALCQNVEIDFDACVKDAKKSQPVVNKQEKGLKVFSLFNGSYLIKAHCKRDALAHYGYSTNDNMQHVEVASKEQKEYYLSQVDDKKFEVAERV